MSASVDRPVSPRVDGSSLARFSRAVITGGGPRSRAVVCLIVAVVALAVLPDLVHHLNVKHVPETRSPSLPLGPPRFPLARVVTSAGTAVLFLVCAGIVMMRGHRDRNVSGALILLIGLGFPYLVSPAIPGSADLVRIALAGAVILAAWHLGPGIDALKWVAISGSLIAAYALIGGLITPEYMMYEMVSEKALVGNWQLAGPFGHSNALGVYCALALALTPLIDNIRWRILHGCILCAAIVASASRTALVITAILALWWIFSRSRSMLSIRLAGTTLIGLSAAAVMVLPLLNWDPDAFSGRPKVWAASLSAWQESRLLGLGVNWFSTGALSSADTAHWARVGTGHNLVIDTLVTSGLAGLCVLVLVMLAAVRSARTLRIASHQIACFGYLIAFLIASTTEAIWTLLPNVELFPITGFVFAVLLVTRHRSHAGKSDRAAVTI